MVPPEPSDPTRARSEHSNATETQENELKNYFMNMIESPEEEIKIFVKKILKKDKQKVEKNQQIS